MDTILTEEKRKEIIYLLSSMLNTINNMANDINNYGEDEECNYCKHLPCGGDGNCGYFNNDNPEGFGSCNFEWRFAKEVQNMIKYLNEIK